MSIMQKDKLIRKPLDLISNYWKKRELTIAEKIALYCEEHPWDVECKMYEV